MTLSRSDRAGLLIKLARSIHVDVEAMVYEAQLDSLAPAICTTCKHTMEAVPPEQEDGWCAKCDRYTMVSSMVLAGLL